MTADLDKAVERLTDMAEFFEDATDPFIAESVCKEHAADLRWSLSELSRLREEVATLTRERDEAREALKTPEHRTPYWRNAYELLVAQTGRDIKDGYGIDPRKAAPSPLSCQSKEGGE